MTDQQPFEQEAGKVKIDLTKAPLFLYWICKHSSGGSSNGRTTGSGPVNPGSNPGLPAKENQ